MGVDLRPKKGDIIIKKPFMVSICLTRVDKLLGLPLVNMLVTDPEHLEQPKKRNNLIF